MLVLQVMFSFNAHEGAPDDEPARPSLGPHTAPFRLWKRSDLSAAWQALPASAWLAIELPDTPWGRAYYRWASAEGGDGPPTGNSIGVMLVNMHDYRHPGNASAEAGRCLRALLQDGRPPVEHVVRTFGDHELSDTQRAWLQASGSGGQ